MREEISDLRDLEAERDRLRAERDEARLCAERRRVHANHADGKAIQLRAALEAVEWIISPTDRFKRFCPRCWQWQTHGHRSGCATGITLGRAECRK